MGELVKDRAVRLAKEDADRKARQARYGQMLTGGSLQGTMTSTPADTIKRPPMAATPAPVAPVRAAMAQAVAPTPAPADGTSTSIDPATGADLDAEAAPEISGAEQDAQQGAAIDATHARLNEILNSVPGIDYAGKYKELLGQAESTPTPQAPGRMQAFFAALGNPEQAPNMLMQAHSEAQRAHDAKLERIMSLKEAIIQGDIQQLLAKGNTKKALAQSAELEKLHAVQERLAREAAYKNWSAQQDKLQGNKRELAQLHEDAANSRADKLIQGRKDLASLSPAARATLSRAYVTSYTSLMSSGMYDDAAARTMAEAAVDQAYEIMKTHEGGGATPDAHAGKTHVERNGVAGWVTKPLPTDKIIP